MSYRDWSYVAYAVICILAVAASVIIKICESKFGKEKVAETLTEADKYRKAITEAITSAEEMFPGAGTGKQKKVVATLAVSNAVNALKNYKPTAEQISSDIDTAVAITKEVNTGYANNSKSIARAVEVKLETANDADPKNASLK